MNETAMPSKLTDLERSHLSKQRFHRQTLWAMRQRMNTALARGGWREPHQIRLLREQVEALDWALQQIRNPDEPIGNQQKEATS